MELYDFIVENGNRIIPFSIIMNFLGQSPIRKIALHAHADSERQMFYGEVANAPSTLLL